MKRFTLTLAAVAVVAVSFASNEAEAQTCPTKKGVAHVTPKHPGTTNYRPNVTLPTFRPQFPTNVNRGGYTNYGGGQLARTAWVGRHPMTGRCAIAFDTPGDSGGSILFRSGYTQVLRGPTTWTDAVVYLRSIGAQGW